MAADNGEKDLMIHTGGTVRLRGGRIWRCETQLKNDIVADPYYFEYK